jgi:hypothetical protein
MTRVRTGLSNITANMGFNNYTAPQGFKVGKVYAVILDEQSVPQQVWINNGGWAGVGTILYAEYREDTELPLESLSDSQLIDLPTSLLNIKQRGLRAQKENETDKDYDIYVKRSITNRNNYAKQKLKKSIDAPKESSGVKNKINTKGTLKKPIYNDNDNEGGFPATSFEIGRAHV